MEKDFLETMLHGESQVHIALRNFGVRLTRRTKHLDHAARKMPGQLHRPIRFDLHAFVTAQWLEKIEIELKTGVTGHEQLANLLAKSVAAIRRQAHDFAFIAVFVVADKLANHGVKAAERVRQEHAIKHLNVASFATSHHGRDEITRAIVAETSSLLPW